MINERVRNTPLSIDARGSSVRVVVSADKYTIANISEGANDREDYARLFAAAPKMLKLLATMSRMRTYREPDRNRRTAVDHADAVETANRLILEAKLIIDNL